MIHYQTKNISFLKVHHLLKKKGVKNSTFFLELYDETLAEVDPFDPDLTQDQKDRIIVECTRNIWYFIRECVTIAASGVSRYELNLGNLALTWACINNINSYTVMPRQCGKTFAAMVVLCWILYFGGKNTEMLLTAQNDKKCNDNMNRIKVLRDTLPKYLILKNTKDRDGSELVDFKLLGNKIMKTTCGTSDETADGKGRGLSVPVLQMDEHAFTPHIRAFFKAAVLAQATVGKRAEANGLPNFISITTTAGYLNNENGEYSYGVFINGFQFSENLYDLGPERTKELIRQEAKANFLSIEYQYYDLGKSDTYFEEMCRDLEGDQDAIDREILCMWKNVSVDHPLGQETLAILNKNIRKPVRVAVIDDIYRLKLYRDPEKIDWSIPYIIAGDCANNVGSDYSALVILNPYTYEVTATVRTNMYSTMLFAQLIADLMTQYFYNSILVLERNLNGQTIIDRVVEINNDLLPRIYAPQDKNGKITAYGINTNEKVRDMVYNQVLKIAVDDSFDRIYDKVIISEINSLERKRNGRIDHPTDGHDDLLISYLFSRWFLIYGNKIERYIDPLVIGIMYNEFNSSIGDDDMRSITNSKLENIQREARKIARGGSGLVGSGIKEENNIDENGDIKPGYIMNVQQQHNAIKNGTYDKQAGIKDSSSQGMFNAFGNLLQDRFNPNRPEKAKSGNGKLYTLDDEEMAEEERIEENENERKSQYNKRVKDFEIKGHEVDSTEQWARQNKLDTTTGGVHNYHGESSNLLGWFRNNAFGFR